jgi:hypothetical protein
VTGFQTCALPISAFTNRSLVTVSNSGKTSVSALTSLLTASTKCSLQRLPYNFLNSLAPIVFHITFRHGSHRKHRSMLYFNRFRGNMSVNTLFSNGCVYLLSNNLLPSSGRCFVVCFEVVSQQRVCNLIMRIKVTYTRQLVRAVLFYLSCVLRSVSLFRRTQNWTFRKESVL